MTPEKLLCAAGVVVEASDVAGGFYCEHAFYAAKVAAPGAIVGFVHVPPETRPRAPLQQRHGHIREALTAALRDIIKARPRRCTVLLTGYKPWGEVHHNPSGDFVSHPTNLRAVLAGLGGRRAGRGDGVVGIVDDGDGPVEVNIVGVVLAVDDSAIDGGPTSVQAAIKAHQPDVVIGLGVHRKSDTIRVECRATDVALRRVPPGFVRDPNRSEPTTILRDDRLYRCMVSGWQTSTTTSTSTSTSTSSASSAA